MLPTSLGLLESVRDHANGDAWTRFHAIYAPYLFGWLRRQAVPAHDADDVLQDVLRVVALELPAFTHNRRPGAFRCWLRAILAHRIRDYRRRQRSRWAAGGEVLDQLAEQLADERSDLAHAWEREHDQYVVRRMLAGIEGDFQPQTWRAFWLVVVDGREPDEVADELHLSVESVYAAKSRVLTRLREVAADFLDR
jgi:RNA polymerase sigma-70 factor (ECF subfamily)